LKNAAREFIDNLFKPTTVIIIILSVANILVLMSILGVDLRRASVKIPLLSTTTYRDIGERIVSTITPRSEASDDSIAGDWETVRMRVTAYCSCRKCCGKHSDGRTASNHRIRRGDVFAAADKKYGFRTEIIVPGYNDGNPVKVLDRGRVIKGERLDVFFSSHKQAKQWGLKHLDVKVRKPVQE
jgi:3D (Asp-Asp-Asp) domain-containing protein